MGGKNKDEVIMVSIADYDDLIRSGVYEAINEDDGREEEEKVMKKVYGKKESPYKHRSSSSSASASASSEVSGGNHRQRIVLKEDRNVEVENDNPEWLDQDSIFDGVLSDSFDYDDFFVREPRITPSSDGDEDGWSF